MSNFSGYAKYYDLLYHDKNYHEEALYINGIIENHLPKEKISLLNLGCGTGQHDFIFLENGYEVTGIDRSAAMIENANETLKEKYSGAKASFMQGDIRSFRIEPKYDVVVSLFHVASYQTTNPDIVSMFETANHHLKEDGLFIFDCWYGPAVLTRRPEVRIKRLENEEISITRIAEPVLYPNDNVVDVNYEVIITDKKKTNQEIIMEKHSMRYFFVPEINFLLQHTNLKIIRCEEWMTGKDPGFESWNVVFICKKLQ
jgi:SAM-dependent methyltransferase